MAKKTAKKSRKMPMKKPSAKPKKSGARGPAKPRPVKTGSGAPPGDIGGSLVAMFNRGEFKAIEDKFWSPAIESIEGIGMSWKGRPSVEVKNAEWMATHEITSASAEGPYVGGTGFAVKFRMDVFDKSTQTRMLMEEVGVYTVKNGKIIREEFMYGSMTPSGG